MTNNKHNEVWTRTDSAVLIAGLVAVLGFCAFILVHTYRFTH